MGLDVSLGCAESNLLFFSVAEKRSLPPTFKNDEFEVPETAGTMDHLAPNRLLLILLNELQVKKEDLPFWFGPS